MRRGARDFIEKPWDNTRLLATLRTQVELGRALRRSQRLEGENRLLRRDGAPELIATSAAMRPVLQLMERVAPSRRERAHHRRARHRQGGRGPVAPRTPRRAAPRPLVAVNLGGLSEGLFESEMFGHVKGAFTDARTDRIGRFELADGGTLLLDEIGTLAPRQQAKLLRVLESGEVERVGASRSRRVDVRILSATNADLPAEVAAGRFREDLLFRLNTIEIQPARRCASGARTSRALADAFPRRVRRALPQAAGRLRARGARPRSTRIPGPATCASWTTPSSARCSWPRARGCAPATSASAAAAVRRGSRSCRWRRSSACSSARRSSGTSGNVEPGGQGAGPEPQRALPPAPAPWALTGGAAASHESRVFTAVARAPACPRCWWPAGCSGPGTTRSAYASPSRSSPSAPGSSARRCSRAGGPAAPDHLQSAGRAARGRLLHPRPRRRAPTTRSASPCSR